MMAFLKEEQVPFVIVATKTDKLKRDEVSRVSCNVPYTQHPPPLLTRHTLILTLTHTQLRQRLHTLFLQLSPTTPSPTTFPLLR